MTSSLLEDFPDNFWALYVISVHQVGDLPINCSRFYLTMNTLVIQLHIFSLPKHTLVSSPYNLIYNRMENIRYNIKCNTTQKNTVFTVFLLAGDERIELPPKVLETPIIPFDQSPIYKMTYQIRHLFYFFLMQKSIGLLPYF